MEQTIAALDVLFSTLISFFQYDIMVFSQWWLYPLILPFFFYLVFFIFKWVILTAPIWIPLSKAFSNEPIFDLKITKKAKRAINNIL